MKKDDLVKLAIMAAGGFAVYWYVTNYGPSGAVSAGSVSWWNTWFGTSATSTIPATTTTTTASVPTTTTTTPTTTATTPAATTTMATSAQIAQIMSLLQSSDQAAFQAMIPTLTSAQAAAMIDNAQGCSSVTLQNGGVVCYIPPSVSPSSPSGQPSTGLSTAALQSALLQASNAATSLTVSQWNYYLTNVVAPGVFTNPATLQLGDNGQPITVEQYITLLQAKGLSGLGFIMNTPSSISQPATLSGLSAGMRPAKRSAWGSIASSRPARGYVQ